MKLYFKQQQIIAYLLAGFSCASSVAYASSFQIWEQDGANVGNYHAGYAALALDASTAFYNPAGITRIKNQQLVVGVDGIHTDFEFKGSINSNLMASPLNNLKANGGVNTVVPSLHYVAPISDNVGFGFSVAVPFGLRTDYPRSNYVRYAATLSNLQVIDVSPSLAYQVNKEISVGAGLDYQYVSAELDTIVGFQYPTPPAPGFPDFNTDSTNKAKGHGYGFHVGGLYQFNPCTRVGLSYHSQVKHRLHGRSRFSGPLAELIALEPQIFTDHSSVNVTLPAYTALSIYHKVHPQWALMGSAIYTQWNVFDVLTLNNLAGVDATGNPSTNVTVNMPEHYRNTWNLSLGADYYVTDSVTLRGGVGYDQTPVRDTYRDIRVPDNNRYVLAIGGHYQATKTIGLDLGWSHFMIRTAKVNPPPLVIGQEQITTNGTVRGSADVVGFQVTWDII